MKNNRLFLLSVLCLMAIAINSQSLSKGVSKELAESRKALVGNVNYNLTFNIPAEQKSKVTGNAVITFNLRDNKEDLVLDFTGKLNGNVLVGKKKRSVSTKNEHIVVPKKFLKPGIVTLTFEFTTQDDALTRSKDYLYTLLMPNRASSAFPCFDQQDIKAKTTTTLNVPEGWKTIINDVANQTTFKQYFFVAGNFQEKAATRDGRKLRVLHFETDPTKVQQLDKVLDDAAQSLKWMEGYTLIKYPFKEYSLIILPNYQGGGIEYPCAIQLGSNSIFLNNTPSKEEELIRTELIAHETAHLWFGNLVSLKSSEDAWAKEVIANYMASKITRNQLSKNDYDLNFIRTYQARAVAVDRTEGTYPIAIPQENLDHAAVLYDNISYDKATVMMRMLEENMGATALQNGLRKFLNGHIFQEATWEELLSVLDKEAPAAGVRQFAEVWIQQKGMPNIHSTYKDGQLIVSQTDPYGRGLFWRQKFQIFVIYDLGGTRTINVDMNQPTMTFKLKGKPNYIIPNYNGRGYGRFTVDDEYARLLPLRLITTRNDVNRFLLLQTIHDNYLMGKVNPSHFGELYRMLMKEKNPLIMSTAVDHMFKIAFDMTPDQRKTLELCMMDLLGENKSKDFRQILIRKLASNMTSPDVMKQIEAIWQKHNETIFDEHDYMAMAYRLAILQPERWQEILSTERGKLQTEDLQKEFDFVSRACNPDEKKRNDLFNSLLKPQNRQQESWALQTLDLLSADVFEPGNINYISSSLSSLQNIQQTSDAFFPGNWLNNLLSHHKTVMAKQAVENYLATNPKCSDFLKSKIYEAAWILMKQEPYVEKEKPIVISKPKVTKKTATRKPGAKKATATKKK